MCAEPEHIRVLVAEDNRDLVDAICALFEAEPDLRVVETIDTAGALLPAVHASNAHVVILDLNLQQESSVPAMQAVRRELPHVAVVVYSGYDRRDIESAMPALGRVEYVSKTGDVLELFDAVRRAARNAAAGAGG